MKGALTFRQKQIIRGMCDGLTDRQIAVNLGISFSSVRGHISLLFIKLNARSRTQMVFHFMLQQGHRHFRRVPIEK